jgi:hypothetical protein
MTVAEIDSILTDLKASYQSAIKAKSYSVGTGGNSRSLTRQEMTQLRNEIQYWEHEKSKIESGSTGIPVKNIVGVDV